MSSTDRDRLPQKEIEPNPQQYTTLSESFEKRTIPTELSIQFSGIEIYNVIQPASEFEVVAPHHILCVQVDAEWGEFRQVSRFAGQEYDTISHAPYDLILLPANTPAFFSWNKTDEGIIFSIEPTALEKIAIETDCLNPSRIEIIPFFNPADTQIPFLTNAFRKEIRNDGLGGQLYGESLANLLLIHLLRYYCAFEPKIRDDREGLPPQKLKQAIAYINDRLDKDISLTDIASELDLSQYYFCRLFKKSIGLSPYQYLIQQRIEKAKQLLYQGKQSIAEIAVAVGFCDQSRLTHYFKRSTGLTPKQIQNR
jgi:AraC family transcriptional regulator